MSNNSNRGDGNTPTFNNTNGVKLPPISFLSSHHGSSAENQKKLPSATSLGISNFLNSPNANTNAQETEYQQPRSNSNPLNNGPMTQPSTSHYGEPKHDQSHSSPVTHDDQSNKRVKYESSNEKDEVQFPEHASHAPGHSSSHSHTHPNAQIHIHTHKDQNAPHDMSHIHSNMQHVYRHHHHHHHHHHRPSENKSAQNISGNGSPPETNGNSHIQQSESPQNEENDNSKSTKNAVKVPIVPPKIETSAILEVIREYFPKKRFLGTIIYNPTTTWETLQTDSLSGLKKEDVEHFSQTKEAFVDRIKDPYERSNVTYIPSIPPLRNDYINYILELKIPKRHIEEFLDRMEDGYVVDKRDIWGGASGVYTDDSDILCVLTHLGLFNNKLDLTEWNPLWNAKDLERTCTRMEENDEDEKVHGDLSVELLMLPRLPQYYGYFANGINSRSWIKNTGKHNGLSFAVFSVKWERPGTYLSDKDVFKRYQEEMAHDISLMDKMDKKGWSFNQNYYKQLKEKYRNA